VLAYSDSAAFSGAEEFFCRLLGDLSRRSSLELSLAAPPRNTELVRTMERAVGGATRRIAVPSQPIPLGAIHLYDPRRAATVRRALASCPADVVLLNLPSAEYGATPLAAGPPSAPTVGLLHIHQDLDDLGFRLGWLRSRLARRAIRRLDYACLLSPWACAEAERAWTFTRTALEIVPVPRPAVEVTAQTEARRSLSLPDGPLVGIAGRISTRQKGHDTFVQAARLLAAHDVRIHFAVAGDGPDDRRVRALVSRFGLQARFSFLGRVRPIDPFLSAVDALAIPSRFEGMPFIALEALETATPGVATAIDGLRQLWPREWQVSVDDPHGLARSLREVLSRPRSEHSARLAAARAAARAWTADDLGNAFEPILQRAAASSGTKGVVGA